MKAYSILLVLVIFSSVNGAVNTLGWYGIQTPGPSVTITTAQVTQITNSTTSTSGVNALTMIQQLVQFAAAIGAAFLSLTTVIPFLINLGINPVVAGMIGAPLTLVIFWGLYEVITGRITMSQE